MSLSEKPWGFWERFEIPHYDYPTSVHMTRWALVRTPWFGVFVHRFDTPDPRPTLHDHPYSFVSFILRGGYWEQLGYYSVSPETEGGPERLVRWINIKRAEEPHAIVDLYRVPTWTLMFTGPRRRYWGYLEPGGRWTRYDQHRHNAEYDRAVKRRRELLEAGT